MWCFEIKHYQCGQANYWWNRSGSIRLSPNQSNQSLQITLVAVSHIADVCYDTDTTITMEIYGYRE